ncbi:hypothetical protein KIF24_08955 [Micromonospora sp. Llam7]|uniref:prenyltransferase/squalene oxidase repeat-containing protein n=1 Tax=Micromonospora tarapacensis TaxID=2835305 RepID=UPI001C82C1AE|nr:prenyltransferase/squalene oxidase repeat-containing protein [Micromonospora tarapacensis]MBX7266137.1 hypothetical protein [Micromonospora tarapacensis]
MPDGTPGGWKALGALSPDADAFEVLGAARQDLLAQASLPEGRRAALHVFPEVTVEFAGGVHGLVVRVDAPAEPLQVWLSEAAVRVASASMSVGVTPLVLLSYALAEWGEPLGAGWRPKRVGHAQLPNQTTMDYYARLHRITPGSSKVDEMLEAGHDVVVVGDHGCGKSALVANVVEQRLAGGDGVVWLNLSDPADGPASIVLAMLEQERSSSGEYLLVLENLHANLPVRNELFDCLERLRSDFGLRLQVLATSWKSAAEILRRGEPTRALTPVLAEGRELVSQLLVDSDIDEARRPRIRDLARDDAHIALTAIDLSGTLGRVPTEADLEEYYTREVTGAGQQEALYRLACLGVLELQMAVREAGHLREPLQQLRDAGLVYQIDGAYQIGSRRRAQLVMNRARNQWDADRRWRRPERIVWTHLQRGGERLMKATLGRLDSLISPDEVRRDRLYLLTTWETLIRLGRSLSQRSADDPTWGDNLGAAVFAASALHQLNHDDAWWAIAERVRARWTYDAPGCTLPEPVGAVTADVADFAEIQRSMAQEDALLNGAPHLAGMTADEVDSDRMYRNWVLGLLLGFEGSAPARFRDQHRIDQLVEVAARAQEADGNFYPARVPWVTARVVLGLCQANLRVDHPVVRDAGNWLLRRVSDGGPFDNWWRSGTGTWNREEATTAMCLSALVRAGMPMRPAMQTAHTWLMGREREWTVAGREIDLSQVLEANLLCTEAASVTREHLQMLFQRTRTDMKAPTLLPSAPEERLRIPFVAAQLADIVWRIVQLESLKLYGEVLNHGRPEPAEPREQLVAPETIPTVIGVPLTERQLQAWRRGAEQIESFLRDRIAKRDGPMQTPAVQRAIRELLDFRAELAALTAELDRDVSMDLLERVDGLGRRICGAAWPDLPWPEQPTEPTQ